MKPKSIRSVQDIKLAERLQQDSAVIEVTQAIARRDQQGPSGTRRQLLATSIKLSKSIAPLLHKISQACVDTLGIDIPIELYAYNSPQFNAACVKPEDGKLFIMFSSSLLDAFDEQELHFVMGHELGHFVYHHHDIPIGYLLKGKKPVNPELALTLTSWSRYAEFSADRAGAYCVKDLDAVARALFKLASGVTSSVVHFNLPDFLKQIEEMRLEDELLGAGSSQQDWFMTHPFSPLRVKALQMFHQSELMKTGGASANDMEVGIEGLMGLMEPTYLESKTDAAKSMRHMLFAGLLSIANADGTITQTEIDLFEKFFGKYQFNETLDLEKLKEKLPSRAERVRESTTIPKRMQLIRDLCTMVKAEGKTGEAALKELYLIAELLEVPTIFVEQSLNATTELD